MYKTGVDSVTVKKTAGLQGAEGEETWRMSTQWAWVFFWGDEPALELESGAGCSALWMYLVPLTCTL